MSNVLFLYDNVIDSASLYPTTENADLPADNLKNRLRGKVFEASSGVTDIVFDFGEEKPVSAAAMVNYDWAVAPNSLYLEFSTSSFSAASGQTQALTFKPNPSSLGDRGAIVQTFELNSSYQFARLRVHSNSVFQIGRLFLGPHFEPLINDVFGRTKSDLDPSFVSQAVGGEAYVDELSNYRETSHSFPIETQAEIDNFRTMFNTVGRKKESFIVLDYDNDVTIYGFLDGKMRIQTQEALDYATIKISEAR